MVTQSAMSALAVIEGLDVIEDLHASLGAGVEEMAIDELQFEGAPEAFHGGVVIAVASAAHGGDQAGVTQSLAIIGAGVLDAAIGMKKQLGRRATMQQRHGQSFQNQSRVNALTHGPASDLAAIEIQDGGQIEPAFLGFNVSDVSHPELIGCSSLGSFS